MGQAIVVLGCNGMLGHKLVQVLGATEITVYATTRNAASAQTPVSNRPNVHIVPGITVDSLDQLQALISEVKPVAVVNCIGLIKQQPDAKKAIPSIRINALFPHQVAEIARKAGSRMIHFSTDCVYSGQTGNYSENDPTDPQDLYGKSKALGEVSDPGCLTIRSSIIGPELNTKFGLFEWFYSQRGGQTKGYSRAMYTGLPTLEMSKLVLHLIRNHPDLSGVYNVASEPISKLEILKLINESLNLKTQITDDPSIAIDRTLNGTRFREATGYKAPSWKTLIQEMTADPDIKGRLA